MSEERRRDDPDAQWNQERRSRSRKDRKRWCKGKEGVEHVPEITKQSWARTRDCRRGRGWQWFAGQPVSVEWTCWHQESCGVCGKILVPFLNPAECPELPDDLKATV